MTEPWYLPVGDEVDIFRAAYAARLPVLLKGPTGCGKTRFVEHMAWQLERELVTVACHEDLTGDRPRRALPAGGRRDGVDRRPADPSRARRRDLLPRRGRRGAQGHHRRRSTRSSDHRRILPIEKRAELLDAARRLPAGHLLQPRLPERPQGPQALDAPALRRASSSTTRPWRREAAIIAHESGADPGLCERLARIGEKTRHLREHGFLEGRQHAPADLHGPARRRWHPGRGGPATSPSPARSATTPRCSRRSPRSSTCCCREDGGRARVPRRPAGARAVRRRHRRTVDASATGGGR